MSLRLAARRSPHGDARNIVLKDSNRERAASSSLQPHSEAAVIHVPGTYSEELDDDSNASLEIESDGASSLDYAHFFATPYI
jgi:hypothetical protein